MTEVWRLVIVLRFLPLYEAGRLESFRIVMDAPTKSQLTVTLNEAYIPSHPSVPDLCLLLSFKGQVLKVLRTQCFPSTPSIVKTQNVLPTDPIHLELVNGGTVLGAVDCSLNDLVGDTVSGEMQQWVKIALEATEGEEGGNRAEGESAEGFRKFARVHLTIALQKIQRKTNRSPIKKVQTPVPQPAAAKTKCPFLERLMQGDESESERKLLPSPGADPPSEDRYGKPVS